MAWIGLAFEVGICMYFMTSISFFLSFFFSFLYGNGHCTGSWTAVPLCRSVLSSSESRIQKIFFNGCEGLEVTGGRNLGIRQFVIWVGR